MRIIGGKFRSRVLAEFEGEDVRPTADRVKESLFNILSLKLYGARVLDLFAGSGALGLESLSRGAKEVCFNDCAKASLAILKKNLTALKITPNGEEAKLTNCDYLVCLEQARGQFDLIFIDPPYRFDFGERHLKKLRKEAYSRKTALLFTSVIESLRVKLQDLKNMTKESTEKPI